MKILGPTPYPRLNEGVGIVFLGLAVAVALSLASYHPEDPSWNTAAAVVKPSNLIGRWGAHVADALLQIAGLGAFTLPILLFLLAWKWLRSEAIEAQYAKFSGASMLVTGVCTAFSLSPQWRPFGSAIAAGGLLGTVCAEYLLRQLNTTGAILFTASWLILSLYLVSRFSMSMVWAWLEGPLALLHRIWVKWQSWREIRRHRRQAQKKARIRRVPAEAPQAPEEAVYESQNADADSMMYRTIVEDERADNAPPWEQPEPEGTEAEESEPDIPIHALEDYQPRDIAVVAEPAPVRESERPASPRAAPQADEVLLPTPSDRTAERAAGRPAFDAQELKDIAARIKAKFEEFNVLGSVVQINPGPVVTTFEFKPEAGIKYSRITTLTEDLCLGLASRIDSDRAHSRQADRRHRGAEQQPRSDQPAPDSRIRRVPQFRHRR